MIEDLLAYIKDKIIYYVTCSSMQSKENAHSKMEANGVSPPSIVLNVEKFIRDVENRPAIWNRNYHCNKLFMEKTWDELSALHNLPKFTLKTKWKGLRDNFRVEYKRIPRNEYGEMIIPPEEHDSKWTHYLSLLFLVEHMRHRQPKPESQSYYYQPQLVENGDEYEETLVEPDLTTGLINLSDTEESVSYNMANLIPAPESSSNDSAMYSNSGSRIGYGTYGSSSGYDGNQIPPLTIKRKRSSDESVDIKLEPDAVEDPDDDYHYLLSLHPYMKQLSASQKLRLRTKIQKLIFKELYKEDLDEGK